MIRFSLLPAFLLMLLGVAVCTAEQNDPGEICGRWVTSAKAPVAGGLALFFNDALGPPPLPERYWRAADETVGMDADGRFTAQLPPGEYFLGTMKRKRGNDRGPLREGDLYTLTRDEKGKPKLFSVKSGQKIDAGVITDGLTYRKEYNMEGITAIQGRVTDEKGNPAEGTLVFAYATPEMTGRPLHVSDPTEKDGAFLLRLSLGGNYYLKIRDNYGGGQPEPGEMMGGYGEQLAPTAVSVATGSITKGIEIKGRRFTGRGRKLNQEIVSPSEQMPKGSFR